MKKLFNDGKALAIGVSNFEQNHREDIIMMNSMIPLVNQVEYHPYFHEDGSIASQKTLIFPKKTLIFPTYTRSSRSAMAVAARYSGELMHHESGPHEGETVHL